MITKQNHKSIPTSLHVCVIGGPTPWRMGMQALLAGQPHLACVRESVAVEKYIEAPDIYVVDGRSPELLPALLNLQPLVPLLIVADDLVETSVHSWLAQGIKGCVERDVTLLELLDAIRQIAAGEISLPPKLTIRLIASMAIPRQLHYTLAWKHSPNANKKC